MSKQEAVQSPGSAASPDTVQELMTVKEAASSLRMSRANIYNLMDQGELAYLKIGRCRRIPRKALQDLISRSMVQAGTQAG
jgi:excisionase family DNA binding protein